MSGTLDVVGGIGVFFGVVGAFAVLPALLAASAARSAVPRRGPRLRVVQSGIAALVVLAPVVVYLEVSAMVASHRVVPVASGTAAAGVVVALSSVVTYLRLERSIPDGE